MSRTGENIYKRKDGRWEGRCIFSYGENGKAKYKYVYAKSYKEVRAKLLDVALKKSESTVSSVLHSEKAKYSYWIDEWLQSKKVSIKESTYIRYRNSVEKHIKPHLGKYAIDKISTSLMESFVSKLMLSGRLNGEGGLSAKTISDIIVIVKESFKYARNHGATTICDFDIITLKKITREMRVLSNSEMQRLIATLLNESDLYKIGVFLCLFTGIRIGELCALQWKHISLADKTIKIEQTMQRLQNQDTNLSQKTRVVVTEPKSVASIRIIPIPNFIVEVITPYQRGSNVYFLTGECKAFVEPRTMQNRFKGYLLESDIADANFHALRHTFATHCMEVGFDVKTLSQILGHSSVKITLDKYVHSSLDLKRMNMDKLQLNYLSSK